MLYGKKKKDWGWEGVSWSYLKGGGQLTNNIHTLYSHSHIKAVLLSVPLNPHFPHLHECCLFHFYPPLPLWCLEAWLPWFQARATEEYLQQG